MIASLLLMLVAQDTLTPVVVTATRVPVAADRVAVSVTVLAGDALRAQGLRTVADALRGVPGATVLETGSIGGQVSLFLRGGESDYVKVLVDGMPVNQPGGGLDLADLTLDNVERIEIVRGPGSVLYGSDAMTGVIQVFTRSGVGGGSPRVTAEAGAGTFGTRRGAVGLAGRLGPRVTYTAHAARLGAAGLYPYNNEYRNTVLSGQVQAIDAAGTRAALAYRFGNATYQIPTNGAGEPVDSNAASTERGPGLSLTLSRPLGRFDAHVGATLREQRIVFTDSADSPGEDGSFRSRDYVRRAAANAMVTWRAREAVLVTGGIEYEDERQHGRSEFSASFGTFPDSIRVQRFTTAYYAQLLLGAAGPVTVTIGARLDDNSAFGEQLTARAGVSWRLDERSRIRGSVGTGFKEPTFFENFARGFVRGNPDLDPERTRSWEVGVEHVFPGDRVSLAVTYFDQRFRDLIEFASAPPPGEPNYFNVAGASADGVEAELTASLGARLTLGARYTHLSTRVEEAGLDGGPDGLFTAGQPLLRRPGHTFAPRLVVDLAGGARATLAARWMDARTDLDFGRPAGQRRVTVPGSVRVDVSGDLGPPALRLTLRVENLFDDRTPETAGFRSRGRTVSVGARVSVAN